MTQDKLKKEAEKWYNEIYEKTEGELVDAYVGADEHLIKVVIEGTSPYVMQSAEPSASEKNVSEQEIISKHLQATKKGNYFVRTSQLRGSLIEAGKGEKIPGERMATYSKWIAECVNLEPTERIPITSSNKHEPWTRMVCINDAYVPAIRPRLNKWKAEFAVKIPTKLNERSKVNVDELRKIFEKAGTRKGIGNARPLGMGRFKITEFSILQ